MRAMANNVRPYTNQQILDRVRACPSFHGFPPGYWLVGVRSNEDAFNVFDDKFYCFKGDKFIATWQCTTNAGPDMLNPTNPRGEAVLKAGDIYYDSHERRLHRGKVLAYGQRRALPLHRDNDRDRRTEELGVAKNEIVGINIHPASYQFGSKAEREYIGAWSQGCQVFAIRDDFDDFMRFTEGQRLLTYALVLEWDPSQFAGLTDKEIDDTISAAIPTVSDRKTDAQPTVSPDLNPPPAVSAADPQPAGAPPMEQQAETIINNQGNVLDRGLNKASEIGDKFAMFQGVLDKFGFSNPDAVRSKGSVLIVVLQFVFAPLIAVAGFLYANPEYGIPAAVVLVLAAVWLWNESGKRRAHAREGLPKDLAEKIVNGK